jgi:hypothetical protein
MARTVRHDHPTDHTSPAHRPVDDRSRFGGVDIPATLAGLFSAIGVLVVLGGLLAAAGSFGYQTTNGSSGTGTEEIGDSLAIGGLVAGFVTLLVAFLVGGWVAGRVGRYDGGRNGLLTAVWFVLAAAAMAALGAWAGDRYDVFADIELPAWFSNSDTTTAAIISGAVGILLALLAGFLGGKLGERYHRRADAEVVRTNEIDVRERTVVHDDEHRHHDHHDHEDRDVTAHDHPERETGRSGDADHDPDRTMPVAQTVGGSTTSTRTPPPPPPPPTAENTVVEGRGESDVVVGETRRVDERR